MSSGARDADRGPSSAVHDPVAERDARRNAREARRGPSTDRPEVRKPAQRRRARVDARLMRGVVTAGIVAIVVAIAAVMGSRGAQAWLIGLVASVLSLALAAYARSSKAA